MSKSTATSTVTVILAASAAAATLMLALAPAWVPQQAHDGLRVVELPRVVVTAQREQAAAPQVVELPRVVISARRDSHPASDTAAAGASSPSQLARVPGSAQPVMARQPR